MSEFNHGNMSPRYWLFLPLLAGYSGFVFLQIVLIFLAVCVNCNDD
jgi:hypothetical protein